MNLFRAIGAFFSKPVFRNEKFIFGLWMLAALLMSLQKTLGGISGNYNTFQNVFWHTIEQVNLYTTVFNTNHYGPAFSIVVAPFALLPEKVGSILWGVSLAFVLYMAIRQLPVVWGAKVAIYYICWHEMITATSNMQTNTLVAALIIFTFSFIHKGKDGWAALCIALGTFIKLYGIVGFAFFFFSRNKPKLILSFIGWSVLLFVLPMLLSSPDFIIQSYQDWYLDLVNKNMMNTDSMAQDISVMGLFRRVFNHREWSNLFFLIPGIFLFALQYSKIKNYRHLTYRLGILASTLLFVVLFSSGSESSTYIIAMAGVAVWFIIQRKPYSAYAVALLVFVLLITSFSPSDLFPAYLYKNFIMPYALKALPCAVVWGTLVYQLLCKENSLQPLPEPLASEG